MHSSLEDKRCQEYLSMSFLKCWQRDPQGMKRFGSFKAMSLKGLNQDSNIKHSHSFIFFYSLSLVCIQFQSVRWDLKTIKICDWNFCHRMDPSVQRIDWLYEHFSKIKGRHLCVRIIGPNQSHAVPLIAAENILQIMCVISRKANHC